MYGCKNPQIFFIRLNFKWFKKFLAEKQESIEFEVQGEFTLLELLFRFYFLDYKHEQAKKMILLSLQRLLLFLLELRYRAKAEF